MFTMVSGVVAFVLVFVLFVVILMTQSFNAPATQTSTSGSKTTNGMVKKANSSKAKVNSATDQSVDVGTEDGVDQSVTVR